ncbi:TIGR04500 family putative peptide maturation system protein [Sphaerimonospora cavernae]|uniref:TIGR04500 family putative peptide maturation system protein n=1 Tax=Sphaerimonospora cavernae TaxID=1740611 RepID=A0ABV6TYE1_9ACTN
MSDFGSVLESGVELLRGLRRRRDDVGAARRTVAEWAAGHPETHAELVVDVRPGTPVVDYDLLLEHPGGGTVALTSSTEDGVPWLIDHSTHWAAGHLVSVGEVYLTLPQALTMLRSLSRPGRTPHDEIVEQCLLLNETNGDDEPLSAADLQSVADDFRRTRGLHGREATLSWLAEMGMSPAQFEEYVEGMARRRRFRRRKEAELAADHLTAHRTDFDGVRALWVIAPAPVPADLLADPAALLDIEEAEVTVGERRAAELPEPLRTARPGEVVGPVEHGNGFLTGVVRERRPAGDDEQTLAAAGHAAFTAWLTERRAQTSIEWHWL